MKTNINILFTIALISLATLTYAQINYGTNTVTGTNASAIGDNNTASGNSSFVGGIDSEALGKYSLAFGDSAKVWSRNGIALGKQVSVFGAYSFGVGENVKTTTTSSMVIGIGYNDYHPLVNGTSRSLMIGFRSDRPTLFVGPATGLGLTGKIGIGDVTDPHAKLHIRADDGENVGLLLEPGGSGNFAKIKFGETSDNVSPNRIEAKQAGDLDFYTASDYVFRDGNVGIGEINPTEKLEVDGTVKSTGLLLNNGTQAVGKILQSDANGLASWVDPMTLAVDDGDWATNGNDMYNLNSGYLGIGTTNPDQKLELANGGIQLNGQYGIGFNGDIPYDGDAGEDRAKIYYDADFGGQWKDYLVIEKTDNNITTDGGIAFTTKGSDNVRDILMVVKGNGNVGIGTQDPSEKLEVDGTLKLSGFMLTDGNQANGRILQSDANGNASWTDMPPLGDDDWTMSGGNVYRLNGNVGIGLNNPGEKLEVAGNIKAMEMDLSGKLEVYGKIEAGEIEVKNMEKWEDEVFEDNYDLATLTEVEGFIKENGHLPEIPCEADVLENGYIIGEMDAMLLKKIEELTLYVIEQQKEIDKLKEKR